MDPFHGSPLGHLTQAFVGPAMQKSIAMTQNYAMNRFAPSPIYSQPPPEKDQYLPAPGPYSTGATWSESFATLGTIFGLTGIFMGVGAVLGLSATGCGGRRKPDDNTLIRTPSGSPSEDLDSVSQAPSDHPIETFMQWAEEHFDESDTSSSNSPDRMDSSPPINT